MKVTVKGEIEEFLKKNPIKSFTKSAEPTAVAYETYLKTGKKTTYSYFNRIFNQVK